MIPLTRFDGTTFLLNEDLIQYVEETPDTLITLVDGQRLVVKESARALTHNIIKFRAAIVASAGVPVTTGSTVLREPSESSCHRKY